MRWKVSKTDFKDGLALTDPAEEGRIGVEHRRDLRFARPGGKKLVSGLAFFAAGRWGPDSFAPGVGKREKSETERGKREEGRGEKEQRNP